MKHMKKIIPLIILAIVAIIYFFDYEDFFQIDSIDDESKQTITSTTSTIYVSSQDQLKCRDDQYMVGIRSIDGDRYFCRPLTDMDQGERFFGTGEEIFTLTGYFKQYEEAFYGIDFDPNRDLAKLIKCDGFVVTGGSEDFIKAYSEKYIYLVDGYPVIPLRRVQLRKGYKYYDLPSEIYSSTPENPYTFNMKLRPLPGRDRNPCEDVAHLYTI